MTTTEATDFDIARLRARRTNKWHKFPPDVLPAWVADMDFGVAPSITAALARLTRNQEYGYAARDGVLAAAFVRRMERRFGSHTIPPTRSRSAIWCRPASPPLWRSANRVTQSCLQLPSYPPFMRAIGDTGRRLIASPMRDDGTRWMLDFGAYEAARHPRLRMLIFCHPQNPTGRAFTRAELEEVADFAIRHDLVVVSDEIHADIVYPGNTHIPLASLHPEIAARTITITSGNKSFNIPALRCAVMHFGAPALKERFEKRIPSRLLGSPGVTGVDATVAAWDDGQPWLNGNLRAITGEPRLAGGDARRHASGRDDAGAGGDISGLARLPGAGIAVPGRAVLSGIWPGWAEFRRDLWRGLLGVRAAEFRDAGGDTEGDCSTDGGGGDATFSHF